MKKNTISRVKIEWEDINFVV